VFVLDYKCADLHQWLHLISPFSFCTKPCPLVQHRHTIVSLLYDKEYPDKWRLIPDNSFSIASVGNRLGEGGTVFWQIAPDSSGYWHPVSCSLLRFPTLHHGAGPLQRCPLSMGRAGAKITDAGQSLRGNRCPLCLPVVEVP